MQVIVLTTVQLKANETDLLGETVRACHLSCVEGLLFTTWLLFITLHEEHVYEVNENAGSKFGVLCREGQPLVEYHEHQVAK